MITTRETLTDYSDLVSITNDLEAYKFIFSQLIEQGMKSNYSVWTDPDTGQRVEDEGECRYMSIHPDNENIYLRCAVGQLINHNHYCESLEGNTVDDEYVIEVLKMSNPDWTIDEASINMLKITQRIHDYYNVTDWPILFYFAAGIIFGKREMHIIAPYVDNVEDIMNHAYRKLFSPINTKSRLTGSPDIFMNLGFMNVEWIEKNSDFMKEYEIITSNQSDLYGLKSMAKEINLISMA